MQKQGTEPSTASKRRNETPSRRKWQDNPAPRADILYSDVLTHWKKGQVICKRGKVTVHFKGDSSTLEVLMKTVLAVNQRTTHHTVSLWYNRLQKMHHGELDFDFNFSVDDVTTLVQHGTLDLADKHARASCDPPPTRTSKIGRSFKRTWVSLWESQRDKQMWRKRTFYWKMLVPRQSAEWTKTKPYKRRKWKQTKWET